jgi:tetratricopeptide (TPR) repeat protein
MASETNASQLLREGQSYQFAEPPDYAAAEKAYRAATSASPAWGEPYHWLGFVLARQGHLQDAADAYLRAIHLLADDPRPLIALGDLQRRQGQFKEAIRSLQEGLALRPHYAEADARLMLAEAFECAGDLEQAVAQWRIVAQMESSYPSKEKPMEEAKRQLSKHGLEVHG